MEQMVEGAEPQSLIAGGSQDIDWFVIEDYIRDETFSIDIIPVVSQR